MKSILILAAAAALCVSSAQALDYTWTGAAADGDWGNSANWDANGIPVDTDLTTTELDQQTQNDNIIINGGAAPSVNVPEFSGGNAFDSNNENTPEIAMLLGTMTVSVGTWGGQGQVHKGAWSSSVGDGDTGNGLAVLNYNVIQGAGSGLNRDDNSLMAWTVNADGTLNLTYTQGATLRIANSSSRTIGFNIAGGTVVIGNALDLDGHAGNFFDLTAIGASVTADFGGDFADLAAVNAAISGEIHFISTNSQGLVATDNTDGTFTVAAVADADPPTPDPMTFAVAPAPLNGTTVRMTATTATDAISPTVEYLFENVTAVTDSGWISGTIWDSTGLTSGVSYDFRVKARDGSGNETGWSAVASATPVVDNTAPTISTLSPLNGAPSVPLDADLVLTFSEDVVATTGFITLKNLSDATQVQIDVTDGSQVSVSGAVLTIDPTADLDLGKLYAVQIDANAFQDLASTPNQFAGIGDDTTWSFTARAFPAGTYAWTGAVDSDWSNSGNWDASLIPVDTVPGGALDQQNPSDNIVIVGTAPTVNVPTFSGGNAFDGNNSNTPEIDMRLGTMTVSVNTWSNQGHVHRGGNWNSAVGDGDTGNGLAVLNYNIVTGVSGLNRDGSGAMTWTVRADGTLNIDNGEATLRLANGSSNTIGFNLPGGTVNFTKALNLNGYTGNFFDFTAAGASVTAAFGSSFVDLAAVNTAITGGIHFISTNAQTLGAVDNLDGTFTVSVGGAPTPPFDSWAGTGTMGAVTFEGDTNGDGVQDGMAFLLGVANPDDDANGALPTPTETAGGLVLEFDMLDSASRGTATLSVEHSSDLGGGDPWTTVLVPDTSGGPTDGVTFVVSGSGTLDVTATIGSGEAAGGKLFGRLQANP